VLKNVVRTSRGKRLLETQRLRQEDNSEIDLMGKVLKVADRRGLAQNRL
jgi:hypothetical protein